MAVKRTIDFTAHLDSQILLNVTSILNKLRFQVAYRLKAANYNGERKPDRKVKEKLLQNWTDTQINNKRT